MLEVVKWHFHVHKNSYVFLHVLWSSTCTILVENIYIMIYVVFLLSIYLVLFMKDRSTMFMYMILSVVVRMSKYGCQT